MASAGGRRPVWAPDLRRIAQFLGPPEEHWEALLLLAIGVGFASGLLGVGLRSAVHASFHALAAVRHGVAALLLPAAGAVGAVALIRRLFREPRGHGVPEVIRAVCREGGRMRRRSILSRWLGSLVNVASGGSAGLEGPIVFSGAAVGSFAGRLFGLDERRRSVLLACGVAGGISGIFNAPMTGMIFAMEVVLSEWSAFSIVPIVTSAVCGTEISRILLGNTQSFLHAPFAMGPHDLLACVVLGIAAGFLSTLFVRLLRLFERLAARLPRPPLLAPALFGLAVGAIGLLEPGAIGDGYAVAQEAIHGALPSGAAFALLLVGAKLLATLCTLGSGAPGGVFAPSLVLGSLLGATFSRFAGAVLPGVPLAGEGSYALVGMSGLVAGVMQSPLTGIFLVLEVTHGYEVILPLMVVSVLSLLVARRFDRYSLYTLELAERGELTRPGSDPRILADVGIREALDEEVHPVPEDLTLAQFVEVARSSRRNHFPVLRRGTQEFAGMLDLTSIRDLLLDPALARITLVCTMMDPSVPTVPVGSSLADALALFESHGAWVLPVVDGATFVGLLSKSTLFDRYRTELLVQSGE